MSRAIHRLPRLAAGAFLATVLSLSAAGSAIAAGSEKTTLTLSLPAATVIGESVTARARLADAAGRPVARALVLFTAPLSFLNSTGATVIADALTDSQGNAVAELDLRSAGRFTVKAVYRGDARYAPTEAAAELVVDGARQLHAQEAGVRIPGLNEAPQLGPVMLGASPEGILPTIARMWPGMSGWPIALTLLVIWSLYGFVVIQVFRIGAGTASGAARRPSGGRAGAGRS